MSEKTEKPTEKKLKDAREEGQVPVSQNLASLIVFAGIGELAIRAEQYWRESIMAALSQSFARIAQPSLSGITETISVNGTHLMVICLALGVSYIVLAVAGYWGQFGVLIAPKMVKFHPERLSPMSGIKQIFTKQKLTEAVNTIIKIVLFGLIAYFVIRDQLGSIISLSGGVPVNIYAAIVSMLAFLFHIIVGVCLVLGLIDFAIQKAIHTQSLKMSLEDIKREYRESEGDPVIKGQRRQLARELAQESAAAKTEGADAVVVNPTHFAVAMLYDSNKVSVPIVLAKGRDAVAQAMIQRARERGIPVIRHVWLARTLYATASADNVIPKASYEAVAHVYAVIQAMGDTDQFGIPIELESEGNPPEPSAGA